MKNCYFTIIFLFTFLTSQATNFYVSSGGSDSNSGSSASPWLTIQYGLDQLGAGDVLYVMNGTYNEKIEIPTSGLTLQNNPGHSPILDGTGLTNVPMIEIYDVSDVIIDGLEIRNNIMLDAQGILVDGNCQNITIKNCKIHDIHFSSNPNASVTSSTNAQGIIVYGSDANNAITNLNIINNEIYDCRLGFSEGLAVNGNVDGFIVANNLVHDITNIGIDIIGHEQTSSNPANDQARNGNVNNNTVFNCLSDYATSGGLYVDGGKSIIIENNTSYHNGYGVEVGCENHLKTTDDIIVRNNVFYDNEVSALAMGGFSYPDTTGKVTNSKFVNNTCYKNDFSEGYVGELFLSYFEGSTIENNIFYTTNQNVAMYHEGTEPTTSSINYNLYYSDDLSSGIIFTYNGAEYTGIGDFNTATGYEFNAQEINPQLVSPSISSPDFHLISSSPAINNGNPAFVPDPAEVDLDGQTRVSGSGVDCGVDEYHSIVPIKYLEELSAFVKNNEILLTWSTSSEFNGDYFVVERSTNTEFWKEITQVSCKNTNLNALYKYIDSSPLDGRSYYRLNQFDRDGSNTYSNIVSVRNEMISFKILPTIDSDMYEIESNNTGVLYFYVTNLKGEIVLKKKTYATRNIIDLSGQAPGVYFVTIMLKGGVVTKKIIK